MKVVAINGSARKDGNTASLINTVFAELNKENISTELISLAGKNISGCNACYTCKKNQDKRCIIDDFGNECFAKMFDADAIILGSPVYFANMSGQLKSLMDRAAIVGLTNGGLFTRKVGAAVVAVRRGGAAFTFDSINHFFFINQMIVPGSQYWNFGIGRNIGEVESDEEGIKTMQTLGQNMSWLLKRLHA